MRTDLSLRQLAHAAVLAAVVSSPLVLPAQGTTIPIRLGTDSVSAKELGAAAPMAWNATGHSACLDAVPTPVRLNVMLQASGMGGSDSVEMALLPAVNRLLAGVARRVRAEMPVAPGGFIIGEPRYSWRSAGAHLRLIVRKSGMAITIDPSGFDPALATSLAAALAAELGAAAPLQWSEGQRGDSAVFRIATAYPVVFEAGRGTSAVAKTAVPLMLINFPYVQPPVRTKTPEVTYPSTGLLAEGYAEVLFMLDTLGRADKRGAHDLWPASVPPLRGDRGNAYRKFVAYIIEALPSGQWKPAHVGDCAVSAPWIERWNFGTRRDP
jgi:hypothetical protein